MSDHAPDSTEAHLEECAELIARDWCRFVHAGMPTWEGLSTSRRDTYMSHGRRAVKAIAEKLGPSDDALVEAYLVGYADASVWAITAALLGVMPVGDPREMARDIAASLGEFRKVPDAVERVRARIAELATAEPITEGDEV